MQLFNSPNLGPFHLCPVTFSFAEVVALFSPGRFCFASLFNCSLQLIAKSFTLKLPLGKGFGYVVPEYAFRDAYAVHGTCPREGATYFSGHIYLLHNLPRSLYIFLLHVASDISPYFTPYISCYTAHAY